MYRQQPGTGTNELSCDSQGTIAHCQLSPREQQTSRRIIVNAPYAEGRLRVEQTDRPDLAVPYYETTLFTPPADADPLDDLEREIGRLRHDRDGVSSQMRTPIRGLHDRPDIRILTFRPFPYTDPETGKAGSYTGTPISHPPDRLQNIYNEDVLPRLDEVHEEVLASRGICGLLAFQIDQMMAAVEDVASAR